MCNAFGAVAYWDPGSDSITTAPIGAPPPIQPKALDVQLLLLLPLKILLDLEPKELVVFFKVAMMVNLLDQAGAK